MAKTEVIVTLRVPGYHRWPKAPEPVAFLRDRHRHEFHITAWQAVDHDDREVEIIMLKAAMREYLTESFFGTIEPDGLDFDTWSCERIAAHLVSAFQLERCRVLEDGENGAEVTA